MSTPPVIFSVRVQSQVADANLGTKGLNSLFGVLDAVRVTSLEIALLGDGGGADCILNRDMTVVGVRSQAQAHVPLQIKQNKRLAFTRATCDG